MVDRQAAEARERILDWAAGHSIGRFWLPVYRNPGELKADLQAVAAECDALSVRLDQAEQERDEAKENLRHAAVASHAEMMATNEAVKRAEQAEVRLREYEDALWRFTALCGEPGENPLNPDWAEANEQAHAALAASGGREAPDTKERDAAD